MARLQKGHATTVAVMATLCLIFGGAAAVVAWIISSKSPTSVYLLSSTGSADIPFSFTSYWWGGLGFLIPGILGVIAGCTRNSCVMVFYLVFNILSLLAALGMSVLVAILVIAWEAVDVRLNSYVSGCINAMPIAKACVCTDIESVWTINGVNCEDIAGLKTLLMVLIACSALSSLLSFIATYVSCCSLCNQEQEPSGIIIQQAHQPAMVVNQQSNFNQAQPQPNMGYAQPNMGYAQPPPYAQQSYPLQQQPYVDSRDGARLMTNQVI